MPTVTTVCQSKHSFLMKFPGNGGCWGGIATLIIRLLKVEYSAVIRVVLNVLVSEQPWCEGPFLKHQGGGSQALNGNQPSSVIFLLHINTYNPIVYLQ